MKNKNTTQDRSALLLENIKHHKERMKLSIDALAASVGVSARQVSRWLKGDNIPEKHIEKIADALGVDPFSLTSEIDHSAGEISNHAEIELFPFTCRVSQHSMNGFSLIKSRFGLSKSEIVEWAPALFYLLASQSVEDLQTWVDDYEYQVKNAPEGFVPDEEHRSDYENKREMLEARDVFGKHYGRTHDHARIPFIDAFIKLGNSQRNEMSPQYFGDRDLEGHLPRAQVLLDLETCEKLARGDEALASAIQDSSIKCPVNDSNEAFALAQSDFKEFLEYHRDTHHERRRYYEQEKARSADKDMLPETASTGGWIRTPRRSVHWLIQPTRAWQVKLWRELDHEYGEYQGSLLGEGSTL